MKIKICGLTRLQDVVIANHLKLDYVGFVFAKSRRQVSPEGAKMLKERLHPSILAVGVFVRHPVDEVIQLVEAGIIDVVQLHGGEEEAVVQAIKARCPHTPIIKAISVSSAEDVLAWQSSQADFLLLDNGAGGTGQTFDWGVLSRLEGLHKPYFLAGGLNPDNVAQAVGYAPYGVDVSGGVERGGSKDSDKMYQFVENVRRLSQ